MDKHDALDYFLRLRNEVLTRKDILPAVNFGAVDVAVECIEMEIARAEHRSADAVKVHNGLTHCLEMPGSCGQCHYYQDDKCTETLLRDVRALIEGESRVMSLEEVRQFVYGSPYIIETNLPGDEPRLMWGLYSHQGVSGNFDFAITDGRKRLFDADYGKTWRCWTSRPTDAQREATPWDD